MLQSVALILEDIIPDIYSLINRRSKEQLIKILLNGDPRLSVGQNQELITFVQNYIIATDRMSITWQIRERHPKKW